LKRGLAWGAVRGDAAPCTPAPSARRANCSGCVMGGGNTAAAAPSAARDADAAAVVASQSLSLLSLLLLLLLTATSGGSCNDGALPSSWRGFALADAEAASVCDVAATGADVETASVSEMLRGGRAATTGCEAAAAAAAGGNDCSASVARRASGDTLLAALFAMNLSRPCTWCLFNFFCSAAAKRLSSSPLESQSLLLLATPCTSLNPFFSARGFPALFRRLESARMTAGGGDEWTSASLAGAASREGGDFSESAGGARAELLAPRFAAEARAFVRC
jgi:hypothetical protein